MRLVNEPEIRNLFQATSLVQENWDVFLL
jgi:hypothetical protein